ncbi:dUTP diphosphatase [Conexibacter sp. DBS9H8]|uniref:dUTP diphosphatase n=1 Tax=Conexibacter sp. DBS9H8 TaxID=2937801 RepID=UPI00200EC53C|nr:dUTP diphosphatase [Conexibacter sp. DBS9H8]
MSAVPSAGPGGVLAVRRLHPAARLPVRAHPGDAGLDLHALEPVTLAPGARAAARTGLAVEIPDGQAGLVLPRSGLARRHGLTLANAPGLIDAGFRGELLVLLLNADPQDTVHLEAGERIAQLVIVNVALPEVVEADALAASVRGEGGFGSSGRR